MLCYIYQEDTLHARIIQIKFRRRRRWLAACVVEFHYIIVSLLAQSDIVVGWPSSRVDCQVLLFVIIIPANAMEIIEKSYLLFKKENSRQREAEKKKTKEPTAAEICCPLLFRRYDVFFCCCFIVLGNSFFPTWRGYRYVNVYSSL